MDDQVRSDLNSDEWLRDLFDQAHDLIQVVHVNGTILHVNMAWSKVLGYSPAEIRDQSIFSFIHDDDKERYHAYREHVLLGNSAGPITFRLVTKQNTYVTVEGIVSARFTGSKPVYTRGIFRDITRRINNESELLRLNRELQEKEQGIRQLLLNAPDAVIVINEYSIITFWNPKAEELFGWTADEVTDQPLANAIIPPRYREMHQKGMERYLTTGEARVLNHTIEISALHKTGREFPISLTISSTAYLNSRSFISFIRDISLDKANSEQLKQRTEALERSNADLERFAYTASHDLREPIRKMQLYADMLKQRLEGSITKDDLSFFHKIEASYKRATSLISELLNYARIEEDKSSYSQVNLNELVAEVLAGYDLQIHEEQANISVDELPLVYGHRGQLYQVVDNIIGNAFKYRKKDVAPVISILVKEYSAIAAEALPKAKINFSDYHIIEIRDNGIGFEKQHTDIIFNVFTRLHSNAQYEGTGVGLSIVRRILENHNGHITVQSKTGYGSCFYIFLPE